ncbi:MAG: methyltransferase domain-containing protein [Verrucomicrobiia bacterium]
MKFKQILRHFFSDIVQFGLKFGIIRRFIDFLAYERWRQRRRLAEEKLKSLGLYPNEVVSGPFKGMKYDERWASNKFEKIFGIYESYLHPVIEKICKKQYSEIIDVGCAEGYYVIGFALRMPNSIIYGFDIQENLIKDCLELAKLNNVAGQIKTGSFCSPETLQSIPIRSKALVFSDCEGYELELLNPEKSPMLKDADILVEVHSFTNRSIPKILQDRFSKTHNLTVIQTEAIKFADYPVLKNLSFPEIYALTNEERCEIMEWFYFEKK